MSFRSKLSTEIFMMEFQILEIFNLTACITDNTLLCFATETKFFVQDEVSRSSVSSSNDPIITRECSPRKIARFSPRSVLRTIRKGKGWKVKNPRGKSEISCSSLASVTEVRSDFGERSERHGEPSWSGGRRASGSNSRVGEGRNTERSCRRSRRKQRYCWRRGRGVTKRL